MGFERTDATIAFMCDSCDLTDTRHTTDFLAAWEGAEGSGWTKTKQTSRPWAMFCPKCRVVGEEEHARYREREAERERLRQRFASEQGRRERIRVPVPPVGIE